MKNKFLAIATIFAIAILFQSLKPLNSMQATKKVNVWDTYVSKKNGAIMHFDIIAPVAIQDTATIYSYGKAYLKTKEQEGQALSAKQCRLCHIETLRANWEKEIEEKGYFILEMEGCQND